MLWSPPVEAVILCPTVKSQPNKLIMATSHKAKEFSTNHRTLIMSLLAMMAALGGPSEAQVISPESRRLSMATNQFGIDTLRALDRIEPPDKVLVFCPACVSSTLMMIMMGSSKHQVVSSLRHALYVWSMKPQEINRGFKDIFEHIGFNQNTAPSYKLTQTWPAPRVPGAHENLSRSSISQAALHDETPLQLAEWAHRSQRALSPINPNKHELVSLPALIRLKGLLERSPELGRPWWHGINRRSQDKVQATDRLAGQSTSSGNSTLKADRLGQGDFLDSSQMSALSNIYIQRGLAMNYNYNLLLRQYYKTVIHPVDFLRNSEETRLHINSLVASSTENKIKDLVKKGTFDSKLAPKIMMISTFHFRGTLDIEMKARNKSKPNAPGQSRRRRRRRRSQSDQSATTNVSPKKSIEQNRTQQFIQTESAPLKYGHFSGMGCSVIEVPFDNRLVTLVIVMPDDRNSTDLLLTRFSAQILKDLIDSLVVKRLSLSIPVIKFDRGPINMSGLLQELGLDSIFHGNRSQSTETGLNRWLRASDVVHETSIDIGTINPDWSQPEDRLKLGAHDGRTLEANHIKLDKPFFYFVIDSINSLILTMGRIRQ